MSKVWYLKNITVERLGPPRFSSPTGLNSLLAVILYPTQFEKKSFRLEMIKKALLRKDVKVEFDWEREKKILGWVVDISEAASASWSSYSYSSSSYSYSSSSFNWALEVGVTLRLEVSVIRVEMKPKRYVYYKGTREEEVSDVAR